MSIPDFFNECVDFYPMNHGMISELRFRNVAMVDYIDLLKAKITLLEQQIDTQDMAIRTVYEMMANR